MAGGCSVAASTAASAAGTALPSLFIPYHFSNNRSYNSHEYKQNNQCWKIHIPLSFSNCFWNVTKSL